MSLNNKNKSKHVNYHPEDQNKTKKQQERVSGDGIHKVLQNQVVLFGRRGLFVQMSKEIWVAKVATDVTGLRRMLGFAWMKGPYLLRRD